MIMHVALRRTTELPSSLSRSPPIVEAKVTASSSHWRHEGDGEPWQLENPDGLTVGDLLRSVETHLKARGEDSAWTEVKLAVPVYLSFRRKRQWMSSSRDFCGTRSGYWR